MPKNIQFKEKKIVIGLQEPVKLYTTNGKSKILMAKIDTGASRSSLDISLANELSLGPIIKSKIVKSALGNRLRPIIEAEIKIAGKKIKSEFTLADRTHMKYLLLVGVNIIKQGFVIDPSK